MQLWQAKRSELKLTHDPQSGWMEMQSLLDQHMPVTHTGGTSGGSMGASGFKLLSFLLVGLSAAVLVYFLSHKAKINDNQAHRDSLSAISKTTLLADSLKSVAIPNSSANASATSQKKDSLDNRPGSKQGTITPNPGSIPAVVGKNGTSAASPNYNTNGSSTAASAKSNLNAKGDKTRSLADIDKTRNSRANSSGNNKPGLSANDKRRARLLNSSNTVNNRLSASPGTSSKGGTDGVFLTGRGNTHPYHNGDSKNTTGSNQPNKYSNQENGTHTSGYSQRPKAFIDVPTQKMVFDFGKKYSPPFSAALGGSKITPAKAANPLKNSKILKKTKNKNTKSSSLDWGILTGINSSGSFTPKGQNVNFYGSSSVDAWFGLFASVKVQDKWSINIQLRALSPQTLSGSYTHANQSKVDSGQVLSITDSRKAYLVTLPVQLAYKINNNFRVKAGPVFGIPVKQLGGSSTLSPAGIKADSTYYRNAITELDKSKYEQKINLGLSGGVSYQYKRFIFGADYSKSLTGYTVSSGLGSYNSHAGSLQISIGVQLSKPKP